MTKKPKLLGFFTDYPGEIVDGKLKFQGHPVVDFSATHVCISVRCSDCGGQGSVLVPDGAEPMGKWLECWSCGRGMSPPGWTTRWLKDDG